MIKQVSRLQEQLQAERDLRAALEVGLSMSSGQFSSSRGMDSKVCTDHKRFVSFLFLDLQLHKYLWLKTDVKTRAELEEIALAEADVARLKQKVAELHHQLNQQRQHHYGSLSDACDRYQNVQNHNSQQWVCQIMQLLKYFWLVVWKIVSSHKQYLYWHHERVLCRSFSSDIFNLPIQLPFLAFQYLVLKLTIVCGMMVNFQS